MTVSLETPGPLCTIAKPRHASVKSQGKLFVYVEMIGATRTLIVSDQPQVKPNNSNQ